MNIVVFGATGKTGQHVCRIALERGHDVTAFTRSPNKIEPGAGVRVAVGDVGDTEAVAEATAGHEAAIVTLGSNGLRDRTTLARGTRAVVEGMAASRVERLVVLSAAGVGYSRGQVSLLSQVMFMTLLRNIHADHTAQEETVRASSLNWTLVRPGILNDEPASGRVVATNEGRIGRISRADLADFLINTACEGTYSRQAISVTS